MADETDLRKFVDQRMMGLETERYSFWVHWAELANYVLPRRYKWLITPNQYNRGAPLNQFILDSTGTIAARTCAAGMMSGITSPTRPWFKLRIEGYDADETSPVSLWLAECEKRMLRVFAESNFYNAMAVLYHDLVVFGTAPMLIYEDFDDVIRCFNPCAGEYYLANNDRLKVDVFYRRFVQTVTQVVEWFGVENVSESVKSQYESQDASARSNEIVVAHAIEPNEPALGVPAFFKFRETYWEWGQTGSKVLAARGFHEFPALVPRWDTVSNDAYGRSPAMDALPDIKQLQQETKRKAQVIDKMVNPPMVADIQLKNQPASLLPGGITYIAGTNSAGFKPAFENFQPPINWLAEDIKEVQERIRTVFFNDLFMMISQLQTVRTATEIDARREEKLVMLGPVLERLENEGLDPAIDRTFNIMLRAGLFPPAPQEIQGRHIQVQYVSMLAEAQRAVSASGIERLLALAGNVGAIAPDVFDKIDLDQTIDEYGRLMAVTPKIIRSDDDVTGIREARERAKQQQAALEQTAAAVQGAKTLSETQLGGGQNALQLMTGLGGP